MRTLQISILTLFPEMFRGPFDVSIIRRAVEKKLVSIAYINIRDFAAGRYKSVDDHPYGGGQGMILRVDIADKAIQFCKQRYPKHRSHTILLDPQGTPYTQKAAQDLTSFDHLLLICGHYEGFDDRIRTLVDREVSIGDYILTGGEIPAMVIVDSVVRLLPDVLTGKNATTDESFSGGLLEYPQYTRPPLFNKSPVPQVLVSGNHKNIAEWKAQQSLKRTKKKRPDLLP
jgi:tRNA (guanine37-N1)-methyltransferase